MAHANDNRKSEAKVGAEMPALFAGSAIADITPAMGIQIDGDIGRLRPVEEIRDPLFARALVLESDGRRCCLLSLDLCGVSTELTQRIRREASQRFGIGSDAVMVHAVQNHAAPALSVSDYMLSEGFPLPDELWFLRGGDKRYDEGAVRDILAAIGQACEALQPVRLRAARGVDGRVAFNRRFVMRDGTVTTHPRTCDPDILYCEGPIDPEVSLVTLEGKEHTVAALLHHTCHPCHGYPERWISAGWPGAWARMMDKQLGPGCVSLVLNGACGNIHHANHLDRTQRDDYTEMARKLTETACEALTRMEEPDRTALRAVSRSVSIPRRKLAPDEVAAAKALLAEHPKPMWLDAERTAIEWDWVYALALVDLAATCEREPDYSYEVQVIRIGDVAVLALDGEPFVEAQLAIKLSSPAKYTLVAHNSNGSAGYVPTREAFARGGYETRTATWSQLVTEALDMIQCEALKLISGLFPER